MVSLQELGLSALPAGLALVVLFLARLSLAEVGPAVFVVLPYVTIYSAGHYFPLLG
jgi:hypothetical protein